MRVMQTKNPSASRRGFLKGMSLATMSAALGMPVPFGRNLPRGMTPVALAQNASGPSLPGKESLSVLSDKPANAETPVTLLDDDITPTNLHFVRNNGLPSERSISGKLGNWTLTVDGEVRKELKLDLPTLQRSFEQVTRALVIECGGNGRAGFYPPAGGNQWTLGAVGCSRYTGVRLRDVLRAAGVKDSAVYVGYYGEDRHLSLDPKKVTISRGMPIGKALEEHTLLAWAMNGQPLDVYHGFPLRLVCPGYPGSASGKWLSRIWVRDQVHDGPKMTGSSYRMPKYPVPPGTTVPDEDMEIIEEMPVKSIITRPKTGMEITAGSSLALRGHAWSGAGDVTAMHVSLDFGATWQACELSRPENSYAWQHWTAEVKPRKPGYYEVWARATDHTGTMQPMLVPGWNPKGYLNNAMQRIAVFVK